MKASIQIVTFQRDFQYLVYTLRSIVKFCDGFEEAVICCPTRDKAALEKLFENLYGIGKGWSKRFPIKQRYFDEWPDKGMLHHEFVVLHADHTCPTADFILHIDSDIVFTKHVTPADYIRNGKADFVVCPVKLCEEGVRHWQSASYRALGVEDELEFMQRFPIVHARQVYPWVRSDIVDHTGEPLEQYMKDQRNRFPQTFAEYQSLGSVAFRKFHNLYNWYRKDLIPESEIPQGHTRQAWSHRAPTLDDMKAYSQLGLV